MRQKILEILMDNMDEFVSGENISHRLGVTRAAVWKHMELLREEGYEIESVPRKGYRLVDLPDTIDKALIGWRLSTKVLGREIISFDSVDSTNIVAKERAAKGCMEGTVIIADEQTGGKGRLGRSWVSPSKKGIWMSIVLRPVMTPTKAPLITSMAAVAVTQAIANITGLKPTIKWPNDILIDGKKVCGILTEMQGDMDTIQYIVVGIGINVNLDMDDIPDELKDKATSLKIETGSFICRVAMVKALLRELENIYLNYIDTGDSKGIIDYIVDHSATIGNRVKVIGVNTHLEGMAIGLSDNGALLVMLDDGRIEKVMSGDVSVRGMDGYV